jgi:hypothetical protein
VLGGMVGAPAVTVQRAKRDGNIELQLCFRCHVRLILGPQDTSYCGRASGVWRGCWIYLRVCKALRPLKCERVLESVSITRKLLGRNVHVRRGRPRSTPVKMCSA